MNNLVKINKDLNKLILSLIYSLNIIPLKITTYNNNHNLINKFLNKIHNLLFNKINNSFMNKMLIKMKKQNNIITILINKELHSNNHLGYLRINNQIFCNQI